MVRAARPSPRRVGADLAAGAGSFAALGLTVTATFAGLAALPLAAGVAFFLVVVFAIGLLLLESFLSDLLFEAI